MLASSVAICNVALSRIGHPAISSLSDSNEAARQCNIHYEPCRDTLLSSYPWSFAVKRTTLITEAEAAKTITGATSANPIVITAASHGYSDGDRVTIDDVGGMTEINGRDFVIDVLTSNTFSLLDENGTSYTTYTSGGTATKIPGHEYTHWFSLPTDCLRVWRVGGDLFDYRVENGRILYDEPTVDLTYIAKITDTTAFSAQFDDCLAQRIAAEVCMKLTDNANLTQSMWQLYSNKTADARSNDSMASGTPDGLHADGWINSRL